MSMPRRLSWRSRDHGQSSSTAAPSDSLHPSRSDTAPQAGPSISPTGSGEYTSHYGYSSANLATPIPSPADHQAPILPNLTGETYPLQHEMAEVRRQLHAYYFVEVQSPPDDNTQPALRRLMVTEVDRRGNHHNRQPEYFFNGIIGHIRAGQNGWIDSWDQSSQLANYWRRYFQIPEISPYGNWHPHQDEAPESPDSVHESGMDDADSIIANVDVTPPPVQIHQLATFLWNILNNDREANMAILERLEDTEDDLSRHPVQIFSAADLAHLASHLAESTRTLSNQARRMEALPDDGLWALGLIQLMILPCILKPFPLQGSDNSIHRLRIWAKASRQRGVCVDHLHRCKTSFGCSRFSCFNIRFAGGTGPLWIPVPTKLFHNGGSGDWSPPCTCTNFQFRQWRPAKPSTGMSFGFFQFPLWIMLHLNLLQNFGVNRFQSTVRFSQSDLLLTSSDGTVAFCKDKERILIQWVSRQVIQFSCQTLRDCLCTPDALHNSNSIRYFWASVCVCGWVQPVRCFETGGVWPQVGLLVGSQALVLCGCPRSFTAMITGLLMVKASSLHPLWVAGYATPWAVVWLFGSPGWAVVKEILHPVWGLSWRGFRAIFLGAVVSEAATWWQVLVATPVLIHNTRDMSPLSLAFWPCLKSHEMGYRMKQGENTT